MSYLNIPLFSPYQISITNLENATTTRYMVEGGQTAAYTVDSLGPGRYALRIRARNKYGDGPETSSAEDFTIC